MINSSTELENLHVCPHDAKRMLCGRALIEKYMANHKWEDISEQRVRMEKCTKCQIERVWIGGDMQTWQYIDYTMPFGSNRTTIRRPNCEPERGKVLGFYRDGSFVKPDA